MNETNLADLLERMTVLQEQVNRQQQELNELKALRWAVSRSAR